MSLRLTLRSVLILDVACVAFFFLLAWLFPSIRYGSAYPAAIFLVAFFLHALIAPFKGFDFVIWDAPPDSLVKLYWFLAIGISAGAGLALRNAVWGYFG